MFIIEDWAGNILFKGERFDTFDDAWAFIYENVDDEEFHQDLYVIGSTI